MFTKCGEKFAPTISPGRLAQMVERALQTFSTQEDHVQTVQVPGFFQAQINSHLMLDFESSKNATCSVEKPTGTDFEASLLTE